MNGKELHEETDTYENQLASISPQMEKVRLIDRNLKYFRTLLFFSIQISCIRLISFFIIIIFEEQFIITRPPNNYAESWNIMFFVLAAMMDFLGILNDVQIFKHLQKDEEILRQIKNNLTTKTQIRTQTQIGSYIYYLSIYDIIKKYKYRSKSSISISETIRFLHVLITICIFGNLAISWQNSVEGQIFKVIFLWVFLMSIYLSVFELDFSVLQNSSGPFIDKKFGQRDINIQQISQSLQSSIIKTRYIKNCRRPFQICYIINILAMLTLIIVFFKLSLLNLMFTISILAHMTELIYQRYLQNKLIDLKVDKIPFAFVSPFKILRELTKNSRFLYGFITMTTRIIIVLSIFAFFKENQTTAVQNLSVILTNFLIIFSQTVKFKRLDSTKLYILKRQPAVSTQGVQCSICLLQIEKIQMHYRLPCFSKHIFHDKCMKNWFFQRKQCPLCRYSLQIYELK